MPVGKRQSGQSWKPLSAAEHNAVALAAEDYEKKALGGPSDSERHPPDTAFVLCRNKTEKNLRRGEFVEVGMYVPKDDIEPDEDRLSFDGIVPAGGLTGVLRSGIPKGEKIAAPVQLTGRALARVHVTNEDHKFAVVEEGKTVLQSAGSGPIRILFKPPGVHEEETEDALCVVFLPSGGTSDTWIVWIHVDVATPQDRTAICSIRSLPPGRSLTEVPQLGVDPAPENTIKVCDPLGCWFNEPADELVGRQGWAIYQTPQQYTLCQPDPTPPPEEGEDPPPPPEGPPDLDPEWIVQWLCCPIEQCESQSDPDQPE